MDDITNYEFVCIDIIGKNLYPLFIPSGVAMNHYHGGAGFGIDSVGNNKYVSFYFKSTTNLEVLDYATDGSCYCYLYGYK